VQVARREFKLKAVRLVKERGFGGAGQVFAYEVSDPPAKGVTAMSLVRNYAAYIGIK
jgi:hypothetical protein